MDKWVISGSTFQANYSYVFHASYRLEDGRIETVMIAESQTSATESSATQNPNTSLAQEAEARNYGEVIESTTSRNPAPTRIDMNSLDGSDIIEAWLNELEARQPQHGPLLQSTLDAVGNLPTLGDDGNIYTVSHNGYWVAVGYSQSYARNRADRRR